MKIRKLLGVAAIAGVLAVSASAFTASNSLPDADVTQGYGSQTISGVTAEAVNYNLNVPKDTIDTVGLVLTGDTTALTIQIAFNDEAPATCSDAGTYDEVNEVTNYTCTSAQDVSTANKFALVASS